MARYAFDPPDQPAIPVLGENTLFPVRRILCVGRNYAAHRREMGGGDDPDPPFFFAKPADAIAPPGVDIPYPSKTHNLHHEMELVAALSGGGSDVSPADALSLIFGYAAGVDLTRRDLQNASRDKGQPWEAGKAFDLAAPISAIRRWTDPPPRGRIRLSVNGAVKQDGNLTELIWPVPDVISILSRSMRLAPGDLIYTGTPAGVGAVKAGDKIAGGVQGLGEIAIAIGPAAT